MTRIRGIEFAAVDIMELSLMVSNKMFAVEQRLDRVKREGDTVRQAALNNSRDYYIDLERRLSQLYEALVKEEGAFFIGRM